MKYPDSFLDQIRDALSVSEVVQRHVELKRDGAEMVALSPWNKENTPSFKVNDAKRIWKDFSSDKGGDIFDFEKEFTGCSFPEAVERLAQFAGIPLPADKARPGRSSEGNRAQADRSTDRAPADRKDAGGKGNSRKREIVATYDYKDAQGALIYQVVRFEPKHFAQRRPNPFEAGTWIWGLDVHNQDGEPLEFMRKQAGRDWTRFNQDNFEKWKYADRRFFEELENVPHGLFDFPEVAAELALPEDRRTVHLMEGEKDCETLKQWGFLATTNSGGAKHFDERLAKMFAQADVIIHQDNDVAGRERTAKIAPMLLAAGARVRVCCAVRFWDGCPEKADITDWRDKAGGTADRLYEIIDNPKSVPDWSPEPYRSQLGAVRWREQYDVDRPKYEWLISGIIPRKRTTLIYGDSQVGKSFEAFDMAAAIARGIDFAGRPSKQGGVIYVAAEKGAGFINRMIAYRKYHGIPADADLPIAVLTKRINIWMDEKMIDLIAHEAIELAKEWKVPLEAIIFDTHNAATSGASEIKSEEVTLLKDRYETLIDKTGASVWIVHHKNAQGHLRGSLILYNAIETAIELQLVSDKHTGDVKDDNGRVIRRAHIRKQSEGQAGLSWDFVLRQVKLDTVDGFGEAETSCVTEPPARPETQEERKDDRRAKSQHGFHLNKGEVLFFRALLKARKRAGKAPPAELHDRTTADTVVMWNDFTRAYREEVPNSEQGDDARKRYLERVRKAIDRARETMLNYKVIATAQLAPVEGEKEGQHVIWPTGKPVWGQGLVWPEPKKDDPPPAPIVDSVTGQEVFGLDNDDDPIF